MLGDIRHLFSIELAAFKIHPTVGFGRILIQHPIDAS